MRRRVQISAVVLVFVAAIVAALKLPGNHEPIYQGKPLSVWLECYDSRGSFIGVRRDPEADEAVRHIGTNAIPIFLRMLRANDSEITLNLYQFAKSQGLVRIRFVPAFFLTRRAAAGFRALGASASNAVPRLLQTYREQIGLDSVCGCAEALGAIGPAARPAISDLLSAATNSSDVLRPVAVEALGSIHAEAASVVPVLTKSLQDPTMRVRLYAVNALASFGSEAKPAVPALAELLNDQSKSVPVAVTNALRQIDPEIAARLGVK